MAKRKGTSEQQENMSTLVLPQGIHNNLHPVMIVPISVCRYDAKISALYQLPDRLVVKEKEQSEEMLSSQMLSGIPEVNLGLE